jgi:hypothetical protein
MRMTTFIFWTGVLQRIGMCICDTCKCNMGMDDFGFGLLQLDFVIQNSGDEVHDAFASGSSMCTTNRKEKHNKYSGK